MATCRHLLMNERVRSILSLIEGGSIDPLGAGQRLSLVGFRVAVHPHSYTDRRPFGPALERLLYIR